jgi:hypothetical protein
MARQGSAAMITSLVGLVISAVALEAIFGLLPRAGFSPGAPLLLLAFVSGFTLDQILSSRSQALAFSLQASIWLLVYIWIAASGLQAVLTGARPSSTYTQIGLLFFGLGVLLFYCAIGYRNWFNEIGSASLVLSTSLLLSLALHFEVSILRSSGSGDQPFGVVAFFPVGFWLCAVLSERLFRGASGRGLVPFLVMGYQLSVLVLSAVALYAHGSGERWGTGSDLDLVGFGGSVAARGADWMIMGMLVSRLGISLVLNLVLFYQHKYGSDLQWFEDSIDQVGTMSTRAALGFSGLILGLFSLGVWFGVPGPAVALLIWIFLPILVSGRSRRIWSAQRSAAGKLGR